MISSILTCAVALLSILPTASAHTVITYPGWRGDNLHGNGTVVETEGLIKGGPDAQAPLYPYGMQWEYPCGGMPTSTNRTKWPIKGGALAFQPGWFQGHSSAFIYINMGFGTFPPNMSHVVLNGIELIGPTNEPYPGTWCFPQLPLPQNITVQPGDNATIQLIETAKHGAALYNCVDITFVDPEAGEEFPEVTPDNCFNSSQIRYDLVFTTTSLTADDDESPAIRLGSMSSLATVFFALVVGWMFI